MRCTCSVHNAKKQAHNPLRMDPTRTATLRRVFETVLVGRFERLRRKVLTLIGDENALGLTINYGQWGINPTVNARRFVFRTKPEQVQAFLEWLAEQINADILLGARATERAYWERYVREGYEKGAGRAFDDARVARRAAAEGQRSGGEQLAYYQGTREEFLRSSFGRPETVEKVKLLAGRVFTDLKGVTDAMASSMSRVLTDGLVQGQSPRTIAKTLAEEVDGIGKYRARLIARTEIIRAHAEGQLDALEAMGMDEVGVQVEWSSSPDSRRCPRCAALEGKVYSIKDAHGLIPLHPQCRCSFIPANVGEMKTKLVKRPKSKVR